MNRNVDEAELTRLIAGVCERLPAPESTRLNAIEAIVVRAAPRAESESRRATRWYWWLLAALATAAAASWWAGEFFIGGGASSSQLKSAPAIVEQQDDASTTNTSPAPKQDSPNANPERQNSAVPKTIYRKESF